MAKWMLKEDIVGRASKDIGESERRMLLPP
jgi:hypothetical protein